MLMKLLYEHSNMNPAGGSGSVETLQRMTELFPIRKAPRGFELLREETPQGTAYDRMRRRNPSEKPGKSGKPEKSGESEKSGKSEKQAVTGKGKILLYLHGGGYVQGLIALYPTFMKDLYKMAKGGYEIILLDYRTAPEAVYPTQLGEALDLWEDLTGRQGIAPGDIVVAGDSAGANLTLALLLKLRDAGRSLPAAAICLSLWGDMTASGKSFAKNYKKDIFFGDPKGELTEEKRQELLQGGIYRFLGQADRRDPYVSPVFADFTGFPPVLLLSGSEEMLLSDARRVYKKLAKTTPESELHIVKGMFHIFTVFEHYCPEGRQSMKIVAAWLRKYLQ